MIAVLLIFGCGLLGFGQYYNQARQSKIPANLFLLTGQLFTKNSGAIEGPVPFTLEVPRFVDPLLVASSSYVDTAGQWVRRDCGSGGRDRAALTRRVELPKIPGLRLACGRPDHEKSFSPGRASRFSPKLPRAGRQPGLDWQWPTRGSESRVSPERLRPIGAFHQRRAGLPIADLPAEGSSSLHRSGNARGPRRTFFLSGFTHSSIRLAESCGTEAQVVVPVRRLVRVAVGRAAFGGGVVETAAPVHPVRATSLRHSLPFRCTRLPLLARFNQSAPDPAITRRRKRSDFAGSTKARQAVARCWASASVSRPLVRPSA